YVPELARGVAALGHHVHVLTRGTADEIDFESGIWVHRVGVRTEEPPPQFAAPQDIWSHSAAMLREVEVIATRRRVDCVYAPLWDAEGIAVLLDGRWPLVVGLQTGMQAFLASQPQLREDRRFMTERGDPMLGLERRLLEGASGIHAISTAIAADFEECYGIPLRPRLALVPLA